MNEDPRDSNLPQEPGHDAREIRTRRKSRDTTPARFEPAARAWIRRPRYTHGSGVGVRRTPAVAACRRWGAGPTRPAKAHSPTCERGGARGRWCGEVAVIADERSPPAVRQSTLLDRLGGGLPHGHRAVAATPRPRALHVPGHRLAVSGFARADAVDAAVGAVRTDHRGRCGSGQSQGSPRRIARAGACRLRRDGGRVECRRARLPPASARRVGARRYLLGDRHAGAPTSPRRPCRWRPGDGDEP